ncbi:uncharacterized protein C8Q71DRAFT_161021 [Rhodofomes roseus]|uniref:Arrestin C-terminal-like domain-containing protein n=1 Tax=Rhodofomes roseus TaxID=34475 RepID=A0ABQ8K9R6_9APHY|nr:uncharacterized protein C8Q71DRAFT_161021 [Rhodofomes roseus]KAH9834108.1 hypothetical protein C8Q71DRAFT_161021 [Rhodofomes roseus]
MPAPTKQSQKNVLDIRLAESVVFLRAGDATGRPRNMQSDAPPGMLRGLLTLTLVKPTKISSIEIELVGKTSTAWPEGVGARRIEVTEEHEIYAQSYILFRAGSETPYKNNRRTLSIGPGIALDHDDDDRSDLSSEDVHGNARRTPSDERRGRDPGPPPAFTTSALASRRNMSVDQTHFQRGYVAHRDNGLSLATTASPPYTPTAESAPPHVWSPTTLSPAASISHRMHTVDEQPIQEAVSSAEEFGQGRSSEPDTERSSLASARHPSPLPRLGGSSASSLRLANNSQSASARPSFEDERPEFITGSSRSPLPTPPSATATQRSLSRSADHRQHRREGSSDVREHDDGRGRKHKRFSFANVSNALLDVVMDRVRSRSRSSFADVHAAGDATPPRGRTRERTIDEDVFQDDDEGTRVRERSTLGRVSEVLGLDGEDGKEWGDGWKEFKKGTYTWPISFAIPAASPPTLHCDLGHVTWKLKAYAHRPGTFTTKMSAAQEITVVACPSEDDLEETDSIIVERQWDTQMQYLITVSGRSFPIGGVMPVSITFMPWTKMKVYRISVLIEERVDYWTDFKRIARTDPLTRIVLMSVKNQQKDGPYILPLDSSDSQAFMHSPFAALVPEGEDVGEYASSLMGPGPWRIQTDLQLPEACNVLHFTNRNRRSNIFVTHMLKIIFRVERGDDQAVDPQSGRRKLFDIVVQTPIHILSFNRVTTPPATMSAPREAATHLPTASSTRIRPSCPCPEAREQLPNAS